MNANIKSKNNNILLYVSDPMLEKLITGMDLGLRNIKLKQDFIVSLNVLLERQETPIIITDIDLNTMDIIKRHSLESKIIKVIQDLKYEELTPSQNQILAFSNERIFQDLLFNTLKKLLFFKIFDLDLSLSYGAFIHKCLITEKADLELFVHSLESFFLEFQKHEISRASWDKIIQCLKILTDDLFSLKNIYSTSNDLNFSDFIKEKPILIKWGRDKNTFSFGIKELKGLVNYINYEDFLKYYFKDQTRSSEFFSDAYLISIKSEPQKYSEVTFDFKLKKRLEHKSSFVFLEHC